MVTGFASPAAFSRSYCVFPISISVWAEFKPLLP